MEIPLCSVAGCGRAVYVDVSGLCRMHYDRVKRHGEAGGPERRRIDGTPEERWLHWAQPEPDGGCWIWGGQRDHNGYGILAVVEQGTRRSYLAHRWGYKHFVGPVDDALDLYHLCRRPLCVRPDHLEPVSHGENVRRGEAGAWNRDKEFCKHGHEFTPENTYIRPDNGHRQCKACSKADAAARMRRSRARRKG